jgi:hypothetical protein
LWLLDNGCVSCAPIRAGFGTRLGEVTVTGGSWSGEGAVDCWASAGSISTEEAVAENNCNRTLRTAIPHTRYGRRRLRYLRLNIIVCEYDASIRRSYLNRSRFVSDAADIRAAKFFRS